MSAYDEKVRDHLDALEALQALPEESSVCAEHLERLLGCSSFCEGWDTRFSDGKPVEHETIDRVFETLGRLLL